MSDQAYNGYTNWETWSTMLWINNNESLTEQIEHEVHRIVFDAKHDRDITTYEVRIAVERIVQDILLEEDTTEGWVSDMFNAALERVDFAQIADLLIDECVRRVEL